MSEARRLSESGFYHAINRGVSRSTIFEDDEDYLVFLRLIESSMKRAPIEVHAYCLMPNHYHLLLRDTEQNLSAFMRHLGASYALYFNEKYERVGSLFQSRFKSECVEDDAYFLTVLRYILQNPAKAGIARMDAYPWSSLDAYRGRTNNNKPSNIVNTGFAAEMTGGVENLLAFVRAENDDRCADFPCQNTTSDEELRVFTRERLGVPPSKVASLPRKQRNAALAAMKAAGFTIRRIERVTGVSHGVVARA